MTRPGRGWPWVGLSLAVSCALPELTVGEGDDSGEDGAGAMSGLNGGGKGGNISGGSSGASSGGSGKGGSGKGGAGEGGTSGTDTGGSGAEGGTAGSSGGTDAGGTDGTGGQGGSNGGSGGKGGTSTGGSAGLGGGGTGGAGTGGAGKGGTGGAGTGGAGTGGAGKGGTGGAGTGGAGKGGGGGGCPSVTQLFPTAGQLGSLDGRLITVPCADSTTSDCTPSGWVYNGVATPCSNGQMTIQQDFVVGGTPGAMYTVQMHFYGILGPKNYGMAITRESGTTRPMNNNNGASPAPFAYTTAAGAGTIVASDYGTHEIHVLDNNLAVFRQFFLNSDLQEGLWTYVINYERTIPVVGGGRIRMRDFDRNCREVKNCYSNGQGTGPDCASRARTVDVSAASPQPSGLVQPGLGNDDANAGEWLLVDVVSVSCP